jgi:4-amino-4-deoxychorismate lyase
MPAEGTPDAAAPGSFDLIETMRWEPGSGFVRFERHLARLCGSARTLGFSCDRGKIDAALKEAVGEAGRPLRVRLLLPANGQASASTQPYEPLPAHALWTLRIARTRLDSADALLRHKTTRRETYTTARSEYHVHHADEVILLNERGEVCEGTITNVFAEIGGGLLLTPPLASGLLPGVLRGELLDQGRAREAVLRPADLAEAQALYVGNSLRGLIRARLGD